MKKNIFFTLVILFVFVSTSASEPMTKQEAINLVQKDSHNFQKLSTKYKKDREVALAATKQFGAKVLEYADDSLKKDREFMVAAIKADADAFKYADDSLKVDYDFMLALIQVNEDMINNTIKDAEDSLKNYNTNILNYRMNKPELWTIQNKFIDGKPTDDGLKKAIKALYGDITLIHKHIKVASRELSTFSEPVRIETDIPVKSIALFQNFNPKVTTAIFSMIEEKKVKYTFRQVAIQNSGTFTAVAEGKDGKFYTSNFTTKSSQPYTPPKSESEEPVPQKSAEEIDANNIVDSRLIRIKARERKGIVKVKCSYIGHEEGYITHISAHIGNKIVYNVSTSRYLSEGFTELMFEFQFLGKKGDKLKIKFTEADGRTFFTTSEIK